MQGHDVLALGLDGFEIGVARPLMDSGHLPALAELRERSATFLLDSGDAARTGLTWEHFVTGMGPETAHRDYLVELRSSGYDTVQRGALFAPSFASWDANVVVFDPPYTNLSRAPNLRGVVAWGAHDPGVTPASLPPELRGEMDARFGPYPASGWMYDFSWQSAERMAKMGEALQRAARTRCEAARWLLTERLPDWNLAIVVSSELHDAAEAFWHGVDPAHPLHRQPSAAVAATALVDVYREADRLVAELIEATAPRAVVVFSMGGFGTNNSDLTSMVLLPELLFLWATGDRLLTVPPDWSSDPSNVPILPQATSWNEALDSCYPGSTKSWTDRAKAAAPRPALLLGRRLRARVQAPPPSTVLDIELKWIPATRYRRHWPTMRAFALPSFNDGRIRVNLEGREPAGVVNAAEYSGVLDDLEDLLRACRNPRTGKPVVRGCRRSRSGDPYSLSNRDADLLVEWDDTTCALMHPDLGLIGPVPYRRPGGHTGPYGFAFLAGDDIAPGDGGIRSPFDVNPTIATLLGLEPAPGLDGTSLLGTQERQGIAR